MGKLSFYVSFWKLDGLKYNHESWIIDNLVWCLIIVTKISSPENVHDGVIHYGKIGRQRALLCSVMMWRSLHHSHGSVWSWHYPWQRVSVLVHHDEWCDSSTQNPLSGCLLEHHECTYSPQRGNMPKILCLHGSISGKLYLCPCLLISKHLWPFYFTL